MLLREMSPESFRTEKSSEDCSKARKRVFASEPSMLESSRIASMRRKRMGALPVSGKLCA